MKGKVKAKTITKQYTPMPFDLDCPEPLQNLLHRPGFVLVNMGVVAVKNSVTCKTRFIGKQNYSQQIRLID
jgi:hypothetical protein